MVNIQKANACSPWTPCFKIKEASIVMSEDKEKIKVCKIYTYFFHFEKKQHWRICKTENKKEVI